MNSRRVTMNLQCDDEECLRFRMCSMDDTPRKRQLSQSTLEKSVKALKAKRFVHFAAEPVLLGYAHADYDRRSIRVDLSKTPYALFHKDYYLMNHPEEYSPQHVKGSRSASWSSDDEELHTEGEMSSSDEDSAQQSKGSNSSSSTSARHKRQLSLEKKPPRQPRPDFSGVWKRSRIEGFIELLVFSGVPKKAALNAAKRRPIHIIDHDDDYFRLIVKNGLIKADSHYIIGDDPLVERSGQTDYEVRLEWGYGTASGKAESLVLTSISMCAGQACGTEMIAVRTLEDNGETLVLQQIVRKPGLGGEARARHIFKRLHESEVCSSSSSSSSTSNARAHQRAASAATATALAIAAAAAAALDDDDAVEAEA
jgi:hypothetical protein